LRVISDALGLVFPLGTTRMDAYLTGASDLSKFDGPPMLLVASSEAAMAHAERGASASGLRIGARLAVEEARERVLRQPAATAVWIELDRDCGRSLDELLDTVVDGVRSHRYAAVVSTSVEALDAVAARIDEPAVELIVNAGEGERAAALAVAIASRAFAERYEDVASDRNAERLRQLSEEVSRIASTLARLSAGPGAPQPGPELSPVTTIPNVSAETVRAVIRARRLRARYFPEDMFADPAWDMLLDLLQAEIAQLRVPVSSLCIAAAVPATTALRWLKTMVSQGIFIRRADPHDGRRVFVELAPETSHALRNYFADVGQVAVI
jgi:hypothetical protein